MLERIFRLLLGRLQVRSPKTVPLLIEMLRSDLKERGFAQPEKITDTVATAVIHEAARRAAEEDPRGALRTFQLIDHVKYAANEIVKAGAKSPGVDSRIRGILEFHKVL